MEDYIEVDVVFFPSQNYLLFGCGTNTNQKKSTQNKKGKTKIVLKSYYIKKAGYENSAIIIFRWRSQSISDQKKIKRCKKICSDCRGSLQCC